MEDYKISDVLFTVLDKAEYARVEYWAKEQKASGYSELVFWRMLFDALNHYHNSIESHISYENSKGNAVNDFRLALFNITKGKFTGHLGKSEITVLADSLKSLGRQWGLKEQIIFVTNPLHDTNENIEYIETELKNLVETELKVKFLSYEIERTENYIDELIKRSVQHPTLKIEGARADRLNKARVFVRFLNDAQASLIKDEMELDKGTLINRDKIKHWDKHNNQIYQHYQALVNQYYKDEKKFPVKDEAKLIELKLNHIEPEIQKLEPLFIEKTKYGFDKIDHYGMMDISLFAYYLFKDFLFNRQKVITLPKKIEKKWNINDEECRAEYYECMKKQDISELIDCYLKNYEYLFHSFKNFLESSPNGLIFYPNALNGFEGLMQMANFNCGIKFLCEQIEKYFSNHSMGHIELLHKSITNKTKRIEALLTETDFLTEYNKYKTTRIDFRISYFETMLICSEEFNSRAIALNCYNDIKNEKLGYGTFETLYITTIDLFNKGKNEIQELFPVKTQKINSSFDSRANKKAKNKVNPELKLSDIIANDTLILNELKSQGNIVVFRNLKKATDEAITLFSNKEAIEVIIMKPYEDYVKKFNEAFAALLKITPSIDSVNDLETENDELAFIKAFRDLMRIKNILTAFSDFKWEHLDMTEQLFEDYKSKYLDLYDKVKSDNQKEKVSILEDVDFELELIHRDEINVTYIIQLLIKLKSDTQAEVTKTEKEIFNLLSTEARLRSKKELIEKFIQENLPIIRDSEDIPQEFEKFWSQEQQKAFSQLVKDENLSPDKTRTLIEDYLYAEREPLRDEILELLEGGQPTILERKKVGERILKKIMGFVDTFINGMEGN